MDQLLLVGIGGFFGAISRFAISKSTTRLLGSFPSGTLIVNVLGSLTLGFIYYSAIESKMITPEIRSLVGVGFIGAFTTMSTFSFESFRFFELGNYQLFIINFISNTLLCLFAIYLGKVLSLLVFKRI
jgi:CrcB protein